MEQTEPQSRRPETRRPQAGSTRTGRMMLIILLGLAVCISIFLIVLYPVVMSRADQEVTIRIPRGATGRNVKDSLEKYLDKDYASTVMRLARLRHTDFGKRHGAYTIAEGTNALGAMRKLTSGAQTPVRITINGFRSLPLLIDRISRKMEFPADSLRAALNDTGLMAAYGLTPANAMALFMDNTYEVYWTTSARDLIRKIGDNYMFFWNNDRIKLAADRGLSPSDVMIIASIVDEETNNQSEKGTIGQLYINRLNNNMRLQADPTVRFALGDFTIQRITKADLKTDSPYNTYLHAGLPPGPIRTTSDKTVKAILSAEPNNYLYMCADENFSGTHNFATTYDEHLENAVRYQAALDRHGITR